MLALFITGCGVGMAWPHLSAWAMGSVDDPAEGGTAAAAINTVQLICGAFGAGLAGVVVNMSDRGDATAARWMFACSRCWPSGVHCLVPVWATLTCRACRRDSLRRVYAACICSPAMAVSMNSAMVERVG